MLLSSCNNKDIVVTVAELSANAHLVQAHMAGLAHSRDQVTLEDEVTFVALQRDAAQRVADSLLMEQALATRGVLIDDAALDAYIKDINAEPVHADSHQHESTVPLSDEQWRLLQRYHLIASRYRDTFITPFLWVDDSDIEAYYKTHRDRFTEPAAVRARHILTRTEGKARTLRHRLLAGSNFAQLAVEHSMAPEAHDGGMLGWIRRGQFPAIFEDTCFALPQGAVSGIVRSEYGFHIFKVIERRDETTQPLSAVREMIRARVRSDAAHAAWKMHMDNLRAQTPVTIHEKRLRHIQLASTM